jgi:hypothetical protein
MGESKTIATAAKLAREANAPAPQETVRALPANLPDPSTAQLPANYEAAKLALLECSRVDECQDWADKMAAMASYARQSEDTEMEKMCRRIQARALERCGELLKSIPAAKGGRPSETRAGDHPSLSSEFAADGFDRIDSRNAAARAAKLSPHQMKTALRVANVPKDSFEAQVEESFRQGQQEAAVPAVSPVRRAQ